VVIDKFVYNVSRNTKTFYVEIMKEERAIKSLKQVFQDQNIILIKVIQGIGKKVRIDARTRFHVPDKYNFYSEWHTISVVNKFCKDRYGKTVDKLNVFKY
jgi:predicted DNA-binding protein with PD1-like motif